MEVRFDGVLVKVVLVCLIGITHVPNEHIFFIDTPVKTLLLSPLIWPYPASAHACDLWFLPVAIIHLRQYDVIEPE